ncbi:unnamed protein product [Diplocarpon coronariae]|nr:hypothetical protein JHW43_007808 [Diplocarpon mali]
MTMTITITITTNTTTTTTMQGMGWDGCGGTRRADYFVPDGEHQFGGLIQCPPPRSASASTSASSPPRCKSSPRQLSRKPYGDTRQAPARE